MQARQTPLLKCPTWLNWVEEGITLTLGKMCLLLRFSQMSWHCHIHTGVALRSGYIKKNFCENLILVLRQYVMCISCYYHSNEKPQDHSPGRIAGVSRPSIDLEPIRTRFFRPEPASLLWSPGELLLRILASKNLSYKLWSGTHVS